MGRKHKLFVLWGIIVQAFQSIAEKRDVLFEEALHSIGGNKVVDDRNKLRELWKYEPAARQDAIVFSPCGKARFTVLTDDVVRMEFSHVAGQFEDRATVAIVNRDTPTPQFSTEWNMASGIFSIRTQRVQINFLSGESFSSSSLNATWIERENDMHDWWFGQKENSMPGTIRTLDTLGNVDLNCSNSAGLNSTVVYDEDLHCTPGIISRTSMVTIDDSKTPVLESQDGWWSTNRIEDNHDFYLFAHGRNFRKAMKDFVLLSGRPALIPRAATGIWWTRWYDYTAGDVDDIINQFRSLSLPLDIITLDMNFHTKHSWTGYSFDRNLFPFPEKWISKVKESSGIAFMVNLHDAAGVLPSEDEYDAFALRVGWVNRTAPIPFLSCSNKTFAFGLEDVIVGNLRHIGIDHLWIDWQQGGKKGGCTGGKHNPTFWLNRLRSLHGKRTGSNKRDLVLGRFGGLGSQRYPVGFSGDVKTADWKELQYLAYFTVMSSNVAFGTWSHDLSTIRNPELYVRWIQFGSLSPIVRLHERGASAGECVTDFGPHSHSECLYGNLWEVPFRYFSALRESLRSRVQLIPYWYNLFVEYSETGIAPLRPLYFDHPQLDEAYQSCLPNGTRSEYMIGDNILAAPIVIPADATKPSVPSITALANKTIFFPPGTWIELFSGQRFIGPTIKSLSFELEDVPIYAKVGSAIPMLPLSKTESLIGVAGRRDYESVEFRIFLDMSVPAGNGSLYTDDGSTLDYVSRKGMGWTHITYQLIQEDDETLSLKLHLSSSSPQMKISARLMFAEPLASWPYDVDTLSPIITFSPTQRSIRVKKLKIIQWPLLGQVKSCRSAKSVLDEVRVTPSSMQVGTGYLLKCASFLSFLEGRLSSQVNRHQGVSELLTNTRDSLFKNALLELQSVDTKYANRVKYGQAVMRRFA